MLASTDLAMALDPVEMLRAAGIESDDWQARLVRSHASRILINCSRQIGKSTICAGVAIHTAMYDPGSPILLISKSQRQSGELFRKCMTIWRALGHPVPSIAESALQVELQNGTRIISLPGNEETVRSISGVKLLIIDEASRVPNELYIAVRPMLAVSGGRLILLSSAFGARGFFYEACLSTGFIGKSNPSPGEYHGFFPDALPLPYEQERHGLLTERLAPPPKWDYYEVPAEVCPRITPEFLAEEKETMGEWWFEQEYHCKFLDAETAAFRSEDIAKIVDREVGTWDL